jgi:collagen type VII alpha
MLLFNSFNLIKTLHAKMKKKKKKIIMRIRETLYLTLAVCFGAAVLVTFSYVYSLIANNQATNQVKVMIQQALASGGTGSTGPSGAPGSGGAGSGGSSFYLGTCGGLPPPANLCNVTTEGWITLCTDTNNDMYVCQSGTWVFQTSLQGPTGISGSSGMTGSTGALGLTGATGTSGSQGSTGTTGASGMTGSSGASGLSLTGATGQSGTTGATGSSGFTGASGSTGASGATATTGSSGTTGGSLTGATGAVGTVYNEYWVAIGDGPNTVATSFDGRQWTGLGPGLITTANAITYSYKLNMWVITGSSTIVSFNGVAWSTVSTPFVTGNAIAWSPQQQLFLIGSNDGDLAYYSSDGLTWTGVSTALTSLGLTSVQGVAYSATEDKWVVCGTGTPNNAAYATSLSGSWTGLGSVGTTCRAVCTSNGAIAQSWLLVGDAFVSSATSAVGPFSSWAVAPFSSAKTCKFGNSVYLIGGTNATTDVLVNSTDGLTFTNVLMTSAITVSVNGLVYSSDLGQWVAAGEGTNSLAWSPIGGNQWTGVTGTSIFSPAGKDVAVIASFRKRSSSSFLHEEKKKKNRQFFIFVPNASLLPVAFRKRLFNIK